MQYYIVYRGQQIGPMEKEQLRNYDLTPDSKVWCEGMSDWCPAYTIPELMEMMPPKSNVQEQYVSSTGKSNIAAGVLALLLGGFGIHYFYMGKTGGGFICIALTLVTCGIWEIISFIQGIMILCGTQQEFDNKYIYTDKTFPLF